MVLFLGGIGVDLVEEVLGQVDELLLETIELDLEFDVAFVEGFGVFLENALFAFELEDCFFVVLHLLLQLLVFLLQVLHFLWVILGNILVCWGTNIICTQVDSSKSLYK